MSAPFGHWWASCALATLKNIPRLSQVLFHSCLPFQHHKDTLIEKIRWWKRCWDCQICSSVNLFAPSQHRSIGTNDVPPGGVVRLQPWRTWWSRRSSSWRPLVSSVSIWSQSRQQISKDRGTGLDGNVILRHLLWSTSLKNISVLFLEIQWNFTDFPGRNRCLTREGSDHQQHQRLSSRSDPSSSPVRLSSWSPPCHPMSSTRLWASWSPPWDLVVWTSWLKKVVEQPSPTMVQQWWRSWILFLRKQPVKSALHKYYIYIYI